MRFEGIHHVTCITGDAPGNVDFYTRVLGLRMVKKTVNQDDPTVYHLFYADEEGSPGADITFFEYPGARRGRAGAGMVHTITFRVASDEALDFWEARLAARGNHDAPSRAVGSASTIPRDSASSSPSSPRPMLRSSLTTPMSRPRWLSRASTASARSRQTRRRADGCSRRRSGSSRPDRARGRYAAPSAAATTPTTRRRRPAPGSPVPARFTTSPSASNMDEQEAWLDAVRGAGQSASGVIDRFWFRSIYFREPSGVLFELATMGPGFTIDEDADHLGEALILPPAFEHLRTQIEPVLTPLPDPRAAWVA